MTKRVARLVVECKPDQEAEAKFASRNIQTEVITLWLSQIDFEWSRANQARLSDPIWDDVVETYACRLDNGEKPPRPTVVKLHGARYGALAGNHRLLSAAYLADSLGFAHDEVQYQVYVFNNASQLEQDLFKRSDNTKQGRGSSDSEKLSHCIYMLRRYQTPLAELAREFSITERKIQNAVLREALRDTLVRQNVRAEVLCHGALQQLSRLLELEGSYCQNVAYLTVQHNIPVDDLTRAVGEIRQAATHEERLRVIRALETTYAALAAAGRARRGPTSGEAANSAFYRMLVRIQQHMRTGNLGGEVHTVEDCKLTERDFVAGVRRIWAETKRRVESMWHQHDQAEAERRARRNRGNNGNG